MTWAMDVVTGSPSHKLILMNLADRAGFEWECWPSQATIARQTEMSERTVRRLLADLEERGFIVRTHRGNKSGGRSTDRIVLTGQSDRKGLPANDDRVTGQMEQGYRSPVSGEPSVEPSVREPSLSLHEEHFETFWAMYGKLGPRKVAKAKWDAAMKAGESPEVIINGLEKWVAYWESPGAAKPKWPQGWMTEERWNDTPPPLPQQKIKTNPGLDILRAMRAKEGR
jgi:hypothetical protein